MHLPGYLLHSRKITVAYIILLTHESQVSENMVPFQRFHIQPLLGLNCSMIGRRALVRTDSSIRSSSSFSVLACSNTDSGVVNTMYRLLQLDLFFFRVGNSPVPLIVTSLRVVVKNRRLVLAGKIIRFCCFSWVCKALT